MNSTTLNQVSNFPVFTFKIIWKSGCFCCERVSEPMRTCWVGTGGWPIELLWVHSGRRRTVHGHLVGLGELYPVWKNSESKNERRLLFQFFKILLKSGQCSQQSKGVLILVTLVPELKDTRDRHRFPFYTVESHWFPEICSNFGLSFSFLSALTLQCSFSSPIPAFVLDPVTSEKSRNEAKFARSFQCHEVTGIAEAGGGNDLWLPCMECGSHSNHS